MGSTELNHSNSLQDAPKYSVRACYVLGAALKKKSLLQKNCSFSALSVLILQTKIHSN